MKQINTALVILTAWSLALSFFLIHVNNKLNHEIQIRTTNFNTATQRMDSIQKEIDNVPVRTSNAS